MLPRVFLSFVVGTAFGAFIYLTYFKPSPSLIRGLHFYKIFKSTAQYEQTLADKMFHEVKIVCLVMTHPPNHKKLAVHTKNTWAKHCNKLLIFTNESDKALDPIVLNHSEKRHLLWGKTKKSFKYAHDHHFNDGDWFLKSDDDS